MAAIYIPNPLAERILLQDKAVRREIRRVAVSKIQMPARSRARMTGYAHTIVAPYAGRGGKTVCQVGSNFPLAHLDEYGGAKWPGTAPLRGALASSGLDYKIGG